WVIVQGAGGTLIPLSSDCIFPLQAGVNYGTTPLPTLVVGRNELIPIFQPVVESVGQKVMAKQN
ncbi:MAG: inositol monophosphatase, partial [Halothece sp. Uz-M2-17]|nr:inositol monophosphatase [Halothece sp. Uz-M2-17]